jgi:redox-sensitive bicupin YhaK (pirin superfamily)
VARISLTRRQALASGVVLPSAYALGCRTGAPPVVLAVPPREVASRVDAQPTVEGAGVKLRRALGGSALASLDPFLLLDEFHSNDPADTMAGFPSHPHRGFETVTYVLAGAVDHKDSLGNQGHLGPGSAQWMTAGHGIIHSEMPRDDRGLMWGFQLWVNLPAARKMMPPRYQDLAPSRIAEVDVAGAHVRVVAGEVAGARGPVEGVVTAPTMVDVHVTPGERFLHPLPPGHTAFAYVFDGAALVGGRRTEVRAGQLAVLEGGGSFVAEGAKGRGDGAGGRLLLCAAAPIREPVARYGPFVMNTQAELRQAVDDYRSGRLIILPG